MKKFRPGVSFGDFVVSEVMAKKSRIEPEQARDFRRGWLVWLVIVIAFGVLEVRLAALQLFYGSRYKVLSEENRIKQIRLPAPRGKIWDRNGVELAGNRKETEMLQEVKLAVDKWVREYPNNENLAHVLGYLGEIKEKEVGLIKPRDNRSLWSGKYQIGDWVGRSGVEEVYEEKLRGLEGGRLVEVDNMGEVIRELGRREPEAGNDVELTVDAKLQGVAYRALVDPTRPGQTRKKGAVVVSDPRTGEIWAMASSPSFDPNLFSGKRTQAMEEKVSEILTDSEMPMFNRAVGAIYPPGSTFKMVTMAAAITEKKVDPDFVYTDTGVVQVGDFAYTNWLFTKRGQTEGVVGFKKALTRSTDTFFYKVGEATGVELLAKWARELGYGEKTGVDLPGEVAGLIPDPAWKSRVKEEQWFLGNTYHMAIGQGDVLATPIQVNLMTNILATEGRKCQLHVAKETGGSCLFVRIDPAAVKMIKAGMEGACEPGGTAFPLFGFDPAVACKTGTAEYMAADGKMRTHGWLTAYAPADDPRVSVTVVVEGGGEGSNVAAPVVRKILAEYFNVADNYNYAAIPQEVSE